MRYKTTVFRKQYPLVKWFTLHITYYWELLAQHKHLGQGPFWTFTIDSHLSQACIYWCMVFGAQGSNPTHWKNIVRKKDQEKLRRDFTKIVTANVGFTEHEWEKYWNEIVTFRNKYVVHRDQYRDPVPPFTKALKIAYAYDDWVRPKCFPGSWEEPPLSE